jgi:hypothetical protein
MSGCRRAAIAVFVVALAAIALGLFGQRLHWGSYACGLLVGAGVGGVVTALMLWWSPASLRDSAPAGLSRRYRRDFIPPMAGYVVVMLGWKRLLDAVGPAWLRVLVALLPAVLVVLVIRAIARFVRDSDEMQRRIELEAVAIAAGIVAALSMTAGFLQSAGLIAVPASVAMLWVFPLLCMLYGFSKIAIARRYA